MSRARAAIQAELAPMLPTSPIRDFAVVSAAELDLDGGLTVVSGETGAGKSLLVDALLALAGARADAGVVRHGADARRTVRAVPAGRRARPRGLAAASTNSTTARLPLRRVIRADGGSRPGSTAAPRPRRSSPRCRRGCSSAWPARTPGLLDRRTNSNCSTPSAVTPRRATVAALARNWRRWTGTARLPRRRRRRAPRLARAPAAELEASPGPAQWSSCSPTTGRQAHACRWWQAMTARWRAGRRRRPRLRAGLRQAAATGAPRRHEPRLAGVGDCWNRRAIQADEAVADSSACATTSTPIRAELDRLTAPRPLQDSRASIACRSILGALASNCAKRESLRGAGARAGACSRGRRACRAWRDGGRRARRPPGGRRRAGAPSPACSPNSAWAAACSRSRSSRSAGTPSAAGRGALRIPGVGQSGQPPRPLRRVASGGELARISLAIEVAALGADAVPTMIFDEVDTGIGGAGRRRGRQKLRALGAQRQVLCVTHLPQVAAQGHHHFQVAKALRDAHAHSAVARLDDKARVEELARMLGGVEVSRESRANARQMLARARLREATRPGYFFFFGRTYSTRLCSSMT
jgi:DNA repair protein RecN (Recombination protein N)